MADVAKQCKDCVYWLSVNGYNTLETQRFCHYLLHTGKRRVEVEGVCKSIKLKTEVSDYV